jgi:hypothetical protein
MTTREKLLYFLYLHRTGLAVCALTLALAVYPPLCGNPYRLGVTNQIALYAIVVLGLNLFIGYAESLGLDGAKFEQCLASESAALRVQAGNVVAALYGVPGAPVFLFNNGQGQQGSPTFEEFKAIIDSIVNQ